MRAEFEGDDQTTALLQQFAPTPEAVAKFRLTVTSGAEAGKSVWVDGRGPSSIIVGQSPVCGLQLSDPTVSRRHAAFDAVADGLRVTDLDSKNGTFVGGVRVVEAFVRGGEAISLGATTLRVEAEPSDKAAPLPAVDRFGAVLGASREMRRLFPLFERLAQ